MVDLILKIDLKQPNYIKSRTLGEEDSVRSLQRISK